MMEGKYALKVNGNSFNADHEHIDPDNNPPAYLYLPNHPQKAGCVSKSIRVDELIEYEGMTVVLDFNDKNELIGIEVF